MLRSPAYEKLHLHNICRITGPTYYEGRLLPQHEASSLSQWGYHAGFANYLKQAVTGKSRKRMPGEQRFVKRLEAARAILVAKAIRQRQTQKGWLHLTTHNILHDMDRDLNNKTFKHGSSNEYWIHLLHTVIICNWISTPQQQITAKRPHNNLWPTFGNLLSLIIAFLTNF